MINVIERLKEYDEYYYNTGEQLISDKEYDALKENAKKNFPNDPYFLTVGFVPNGSTVKLPYILGSLNKTKPDGSLLKWCKDNNIKTVIVSDKLDGVSVYAKYVDGKLVLAATRGDGYEGRDITEKVNLVQPTVNTGGGVIELRGEALMTPQHCESLGYSLARSAVAGILNGEDQEHLDKCEFIDILFYSVLNDSNSEILFNIGVKTPTFAILKVDDNIEDTLTTYLSTRKSQMIYDMDGLVVCDINDTTVGEDYYPSNMVAFKVADDAVEVEVTEIKWEIKRSGKLMPVVHFTPIKISGSLVSKATGFNKKFIIDNNIHIGSKIGIVKSGDIIPYIVECYTELDGKLPYIPKECPSCGIYLEETETGVDLVCTNIDGCFSQMLYKIENFLLSHEVEEITETTIRKLRITDIEDLYELDEFAISRIDGMGIKRARTILNEIRKTLNTTEDKLLKSFGIPGIGDTASKMICNKFNDFNSLFTKTTDDFKTIDGIGDIMAYNLVDGLRKNHGLYAFLTSQGLKFQKKEGVSLQGKILTLTGKSDIGRNDLTRMISAHGGMVKGISKSTNYLVTDDINSGSSKTKKALQYGTKIISYDDLLKMIGD